MLTIDEKEQNVPIISTIVVISLRSALYICNRYSHASIAQHYPTTRFIDAQQGNKEASQLR